jgi:transglutaminase-like putative cysteine protease
VIYRVVHITEYSYAESVATSHHLLHHAPRDTDRQVCLREALAVTPTPASRAERVDHFGNRTTYFEIQEPHRRLTVESRRDVELSAVAPPPSSGGPEWESVRDLVRQPHNAELLAACEMTYQSPFARISSDVARFAAESFPPRRPLLDAVADLTHRIYEDLAYDPTATVVSTPVDEVLRLRRGVCQDFTHLEIACLRAMGLPARYVSGYLVTHAEPGKPRLVGADASHAWLAVYSPGDGWVPTDPTNDVVPDQRHITLAWGRDFGDVTPMRGVIVGGSRHELRVSVDVSPLGDDGAVVEERPLLAQSQLQSQSQSQAGDQDRDQVQDPDRAQVQPGGGAISERGGGGGETTTGGSGTSARADRQSE